MPAGVQVASAGPGLIDGTSAIYGRFPLMLSLIALVTFVLLARGFRSILLPARAVLLNLVSLGAAYGVLVLVWRQGHGSMPWAHTRRTWQRQELTDADQS